MQQDSSLAAYPANAGHCRTHATPPSDDLSARYPSSTTQAAQAKARDTASTWWTLWVKILLLAELMHMVCEHPQVTPTCSRMSGNLSLFIFPWVRRLSSYEKGRRMWPKTLFAPCARLWSEKRREGTMRSRFRLSRKGQVSDKNAKSVVWRQQIPRSSTTQTAILCTLKPSKLPLTKQKLCSSWMMMGLPWWRSSRGE